LKRWNPGDGFGEPAPPPFEHPAENAKPAELTPPKSFVETEEQMYSYYSPYHNRPSTVRPIGSKGFEGSVWNPEPFGENGGFGNELTPGKAAALGQISFTQTDDDEAVQDSSYWSPEKVAEADGRYDLV